MKKVFLGLLSAVLALVLVLPMAAPTMAESEQGIEAQQIINAALMIRNPSVADVSQPVTIIVFGKHNHEPVTGAGVYALKTNELAIAADKADSSIIANYAAIAAEKGIFLGYTDNGTISYTFTEIGKYFLVAVKAGFDPGFSQITITLSASKGLNITAPSAAKVGDSVTIKVTERFARQPVADAAVYAKKIREISLPQVIRQSNTVQANGIARIIHPLLSVLQKMVRPNAIVATSDNVTVQLSAETIETAAPEETLPQYAAEIQESGIFIGYTNEKGEVSYAFAQSGMYVIVATKDNYAPGFARVTINPGNEKKLGIKAPGTAEVGKSVTITVIERNTGDPVSGAAVYAVKFDNTIGYPIPLETAANADVASAAEVEKYATIAMEKGFLIGYTDNSGQVVYTFKETGRYMLLATKDGYKPGFSRITITLTPQGALYIKTPGTAIVGQQVSIRVFDRSTGQAVGNAGIYVMKATITAKGDTNITSTATAVIEAETASTAQAEKYAITIKEKGSFLGYTNDNGELMYRFSETGLYMLVAIKEGYAPGFARISIQAVTQQALNVILPSSAGVNQQVTIKVAERLGGVPVANAGVYALKVSDITESVPTTTSSSGVVVSTAPVVDYATMAKDKGTFIGWTDENGKIVHQFADSGRYVVAAIKNDYTPGFARITITLAASRTLFIKAPGEAYIDQQVPIAVYTRQGYQPVEKAAVYAIKWNAVAAPMPLENGTATQIMKPQPTYTTEADKYAALAKDDGIFIGYTNSDGQVFYAFSEVGRYTLVAIKDGYNPDFTTIDVRAYRMVNPKKIEQVQQVFQNTTTSLSTKKIK